MIGNTQSADAEDDDAPYAHQVNAPLPQEMLEALRAELQSEECTRFRSPSRRKPDANSD